MTNVFFCAGVEGFAVTADGKASLLWSVAFPSTDAILAFASADPHASVYSFAKVSPSPAYEESWRNLHCKAFFSISPWQPASCIEAHLCRLSCFPGVVG